jgi:cardiolipin synthase
MVNISNYGKLLKGGVRIYEYQPGFIHEKDVVSDDECAICGTINLDFRSMHTHHENGVFFCRSNVVQSVKDNICASLEKSEEITYEQWHNRPVSQKIMQWIFKLTSPLL